MLFYPFYDSWKRSAMNDFEIPADNSLLKDIEKAKKEWEYAQKRFNDVSEPDMVDYVIFYIIAAERRYMYLLNKYKTIQKEENRKLPKKLLAEIDEKEE